MKRYGATVVFRPGITPGEAATALEKLAKVLDVPDIATKFVPSGPRSVTARRVKFEFGDLVREFDDETGMPTFYVP